MVKSERVSDVFLFFLLYPCSESVEYGMPYIVEMGGGEDAARSRDFSPPPTASDEEPKQISDG